MTSRENFIRYLKDENYEWTPTSLDFQRFRPQMISDHVARGMVSEEKPYTGKFGGVDLFGVEWVFQELSMGSMETHTLFDDVEDWEKYVKFPDYSVLPWEECRDSNIRMLTTDKILSTTIFTGFFERLISFVGFQNAAIAICDEEQQDAVKALFDKLADSYIEQIRHLHDYFNIEIVEIHDDWGSQRSSLMSPEIHREMIMPYMKKVADAAHEMGVFIEQHSCGKIENLVPNIIESNVDMWCGQLINDKFRLVEEYGDRFHFGVEIRPKATDSHEDVMNKAKRTIEDYSGKNIYLSFGPGLSREQKEDIQTIIKSMKR